MREGGRTVAWVEFGNAMPELESFGRSRLEHRVSYLATNRPDGWPRLHPVSPFIGAGGLFVYMEPKSPKVADLRRDSRYALHCGVEDDSGGGGEFCISGLANEIVNEGRRSEAFGCARAAGYKPAEHHVVFELRIGLAFSTIYQGGARRTRWSVDEVR